MISTCMEFMFTIHQSNNYDIMNTNSKSRIEAVSHGIPSCSISQHPEIGSFFSNKCDHK